jgi:hypothetical protein
MYGRQFRAGDMLHPRLDLAAYPAAGAAVALVRPTE